jgi:transcriptional regulator with XRE-family HTH domain
MGAMRKSTHTPEYDFLRSELLRIRTDAKLSQRGLAGRLRVPHSWVAKVESGERRIDVVELAWVLAACGSDPARALAEFGTKLRALRAQRLKKRGRTA